MTVSFIAKVAQMIKNPFQAIGLLVDNSLNMAATKLKISLMSK